MKRKPAGDWHFVHMLGALSLVTLATMFAVRIYLTVTSGNVVDFPQFARVLLGIGIFAVFWFWVRMLVDYFRERPARNSVLWGWVLLLGSVLGSLPYFWMIWRERHRPE